MMTPATRHDHERKVSLFLSSQSGVGVPGDARELWKAALRSLIELEPRRKSGGCLRLIDLSHVDGPGDAREAGAPFPCTIPSGGAGGA